MAKFQSPVVVESRRWLAERARGATLEIGVGDWPSLAVHELDVELVAVERLGRGAIERLHATKPV